jgi:hypothetical protein
MEAVAAGAANVATQAAAEGKQEDNKTGGKVADKNSDIVLRVLARRTIKEFL